MTDSAANTAPEARDVSRESEASRSAQIDSSQYQTRENLRANGSVDNSKELGFANASIDGATSRDTRYNPASAMSGKDNGAKVSSEGQSPRGEGQSPREADEPAKAGEQAPETESTKDQPTRSVGQRRAGDGSSRAKTEKLEDGRSSSTVDDRGANSTNKVVRDSDGNISSITNNSERGSVTTNYSPDGKPSSQTSPDGTVTYDKNGKVTSDTRSDSAERPTPQALQSTQNPDGTTTYEAPNSDGTYQKFTFRGDGSLAGTAEKTADGTTREHDFYDDGSIKEQRLSNPGRFNSANEVKNTWDQNGVQRSTENRNHKGWAREEYDSKGKISRESGGTYDGHNKHETTYAPNGDITSDTVKGDHVAHKEYKNDGSSTTTDTNRKTQEVRYSEFKPGEGSTNIYMTPDSYQRRAYDAHGNERMDQRVDYKHNSKRR